MELNSNRFRFVETAWEINSANTLKAYYAIDIYTEEMILITEEQYIDGLGVEAIKKIHQSEIVEDYKSDMKVKDILKKHDITYHFLKKILNSKEVAIRKPSRPIEYDIDRKELYEDFEKGITNGDLSKKYEVSYDLIAWYKYRWRNDTQKERK